eukprot:tig00000147_g9468.t1
MFQCERHLLCDACHGSQRRLAAHYDAALGQHRQAALALAVAAASSHGPRFSRSSSEGRGMSASGAPESPRAEALESLSGAAWDLAVLALDLEDCAEDRQIAEVNRLSCLLHSIWTTLEAAKAAESRVVLEAAKAESRV